MAPLAQTVYSLIGQPELIAPSVNAAEQSVIAAPWLVRSWLVRSWLVRS
jgi:hypothetical protein